MAAARAERPFRCAFGRNESPAGLALGRASMVRFRPGLDPRNSGYGVVTVVLVMTATSRAIVPLSPPTGISPIRWTTSMPWVTLPKIE
jgi:hypothetical protein